MTRVSFSFQDPQQLISAREPFSAQRALRPGVRRHGCGEESHFRYTVNIFGDASDVDTDTNTNLKSLKTVNHFRTGISQPLSDVYDSPVYKSALERTQGFFCTLYDNW